MLARNHPDRPYRDRLVANAGLCPGDPSPDLGLREASTATSTSSWTLVASALAGGDFIDGTGGAIGCVVGAIHPGNFPAQLPVGPRPPVGSGEPGRWAPGEGPLTIDLDSTMCETYGLAKEGARHHGYTGQRGYHPLLAIAAGRRGCLGFARAGPTAHFLRETVGGCAMLGRLTVRAAAASMPMLVVVSRWMSASPSPSANTPVSGSWSDFRGGLLLTTYTSHPG